MNHDERDELSELLERAKPRKPSPAFVQNVMRAVRMAGNSEAEREPGFFEWLRHGWNWLALTGAAAAIMLVVIGTRHPTSSQAPAMAAHDALAIEQALQSSDLTTISNLDLLLALDDKNPWLESSRY